jgi:hypothetical protein
VSPLVCRAPSREGVTRLDGSPLPILSPSSDSDGGRFRARPFDAGLPADGKRSFIYSDTASGQPENLAEATGVCKGARKARGSLCKRRPPRPTGVRARRGFRALRVDARKRNVEESVARSGLGRRRPAPCIGRASDCCPMPRGDRVAHISARSSESPRRCWATCASRPLTTFVHQPRVG